MNDIYEICSGCLEVKGIHTTRHCLSYTDDHEWVAARVWDCPFMKYTATGRVTNARVRKADKTCGAAGEYVHGPHHYGDRKRRHFVVDGLTEDNDG